MSYCHSLVGREIAPIRPGFEVEEDLETSEPILKFSAKNVKRKENLSILVISTQKFCDKLKYVLSNVAYEKYEGNIFIKVAENVEQILSSGISSTVIDYIVMVFDTTLRSNIKQLKMELQKIESCLVATRLCLVNGSPRDGIKGTAQEVCELAQELDLNYLHGQVMDADSCRKLCERLLELASTVCGFRTGIPFTVPTALQVYRQMFM